MSEGFPEKMNEKLSDLKEQFLERLEKVSDSTQAADLKAQFLGKTGHLNGILKGIKELAPEHRKHVGMEANRLKEHLTEEIRHSLDSLERGAIEYRLKHRRVDISLLDSLLEDRQSRAGFHPVTIVQNELEEIFRSFGFEILDGPHIENDYYNFEALNIPKHHPARDMQDTFWFKDMKHLLRTHTSSIQVRGMESHTPPFKFVAPGKVFRCEATDASHETVFHQMEGMLVGKDISVANLIYFLKMILSEIFDKEMNVRLRPGFFPFVEPGFELDIECLICSGKGCSICKQSGWLELCPCGMIHPNVLRYGGIDPDEFNGFAFGLGLDRLVMMRYGIDDIRLLHSGLISFGEQFASY